MDHKGERDLSGVQRAQAIAMLRLASLLLLGITVAAGCQAGIGTDAVILANPQFSFTFYPPARWTYYNSPPTGVAANMAFPYGGQSTTQAGAEQNMNLDIKAAILSALNQLGVSAVGYSWTVSGYIPLQCLVRENNGVTGNRPVGTCAPQIGALTTNRTVAETDTGTDLLQHGTLTVTTSQLVTRGQWKYLATAVFNQLSMYYNVYFTSAINLVN